MTVPPLASLLANVTDDAGSDPGKAAAALLKSAPTPTDPPAPEKRGPGRPRKIPSDPGKGFDNDGNRERPRAGGHKETKEEIARERDTLRARLAMHETPEASVSNSAETIKGLLAVLDVITTATNAQELGTTADEKAKLAEVWGPPAAPWFDKLGDAQPWVAAMFMSVMIYWPKWRAYVDRRTEEARAAEAGIGASVTSDPAATAPVAEVGNHIRPRGAL